MKKLILAAVLAAAPLLGQQPQVSDKADTVVLKGGYLVIPAGYLNIKDEGGATLPNRDTINCVGAGIACTDDAVNARTVITVGGGGASTFDTIGTGTNTTATMTCGTGCTINTSGSGTIAAPASQLTGLGTGVATWLATASSANLAAAITDETGSGPLVFATTPTLTTPKIGNGSTSGGYFDILEDSDNGTNRIRNLGVDNLSADRDYSIPDIGANGTYMLSTTTYPSCPNPLTCYWLWEDFYSQTVRAGGAAVSPIGQCFVTGSGTSNGAKINSGTNAIAADSVSPGLLLLTTGTTTTGTTSVSCGSDVQGETIERLPLNQGAIFETKIYIPVVSGTGGNNFEVKVGFCDVFSTVHCNNGFGVYLDNSVNANWGCYSSVSSSRTNTLSATAGTAAAWHTIRAVLTTAGSRIDYTIDGATPSCSPITTNVPTAGTRTSIANGITASALCAATTTCTFGTDYIYAYLPGQSR